MPTNPYETPKEANEQAMRSDLRGLLPMAVVSILGVVVCSGSAVAVLGVSFGLYVAITAVVILGVFAVSLLIGRLLLRNPGN
jgi:hypothetical protein